jgi:hypothetical protein
MTMTMLARTGTLAAIALSLVACGDGLLSVTDPDIVTPDNLLDETGVATLRNGALGNFVLGYAGGGQTDAQIMVSGLMTDEWVHSGTFPTRQEVELRILPNDNGTMRGVYLNLHRARVDLENAAEKIDAFYDTPDPQVSEMLAYAGYTYIAFGENYCSGVPYSLATDTALVFGGPTTTAETFDIAIERFDAAIGDAAAEDRIVNFARVGKGRALLNLNDPAGAAAAVASVPTDFVLYTEHSNNSGREQNSIFEFNTSAARWSVADNEGQNGLDFISSGDPRIVTSFVAAGGFDGTTDLYTLDEYQSRADRVAISTGVEARLIEAEAALGTPATWLQILNDLRAEWPTLAAVLYPDNTPGGTLAPLTDPGTADGRVDLMFRERAFWLFSTGHRLGDMRRLIRQYGRNIEDVFPTGAYFKVGSNYGTEVNFPIPDDEENNANWDKCFDRLP